MTKPLSSFKESERMDVAYRRYKGTSRGLGWISAVYYLRRNGKNVTIDKTEVLAEYEHPSPKR